MTTNWIPKLIRVDRIISWILVLITLLTMGSGYGITRINLNQPALLVIHTNVKWIFIILMTFHFIVTVFFLRYRWKIILSKVLNGKTNLAFWLKRVQRLSGWSLLLTALIIFLSGLGWVGNILRGIIPFYPHIRYDLLFAISLIIHVFLGIKFALNRKKIIGRGVNMVVLIASVSLLLLTAFFEFPSIFSRPINDVGTDDPETHNSPLNTIPTRTGKVNVLFSSGGQDFSFDPNVIESSRPDIFNSGYFSIFDILVQLGKEGKIEFEYHFDQSMNTHVIDTINGEIDWWYGGFYDGGWWESNVFRPDHYPWKDDMTLTFFHKNAEVDEVYTVFREEVDRKKENNGKVIIPIVTIIGISNRMNFYDVEVTPHNLRNDVFQEGVITAIDVILSLGDIGDIEYEFRWYESIDSADIVKSYWVEAINDDKSFERCGFVYESGSNKFEGFIGNHIHLPSDTRVLNSPEYIKWFWICI